jgi:tRNA pseudouridine55 synthase
VSRRSDGPAGLLVVDKPGGITSHDVVARVRRFARTRRVGHAGTLDPMATGVLVLGVNRATRLLGHLTLTEKAYDATIRLGVATTTDDAEGEPLDTADASRLDEERVRSALGDLVGDIAQVPSSVSAVKVDGRRAYQRVRAGEEFALPARPVTVHAIDVHALHRHERTLDVEVSVRCSSGTYVRALARDTGAALGVGGHLTALRRTAVGPFDLGDARPLESLEQELGLLGLDAVAARCFPTCRVDADQARAVAVGRTLDLDVTRDPATDRSPTGGRPVALLDPAGHFLALYEQRGAQAFPVAVFAG